MTGVVIPDPRGGHVWIYGVDGDGNPVKVLVSVEGHLQMDLLTSPVTVQAAGGDKIISLESCVLERVAKEATGASETLYSTVVPTGKVHVITNICLFNEDGDVATRWSVAIEDGVWNDVAGGVDALAQYEVGTFRGQLFLSAGERIGVYVEGVAAPETIVLVVNGFQMDTP